MPDEESLNREVEEAREAIVEHAIRYAVLRIGTGSMGLRESIDDFEAAVRKQERAPLISALRDTAIDLLTDSRGAYLVCGMCGAETDVENIPDYSRVGHAPDCVLAAPVEGGE